MVEKLLPKERVVNILFYLNFGSPESKRKLSLGSILFSLSIFICNIQQALLSTENFLCSQNYSHPLHFGIVYTQHEIAAPMDGFSLGTISYCHAHFRPLQLFCPSWVTDHDFYHSKEV